MSYLFLQGIDRGWNQLVVHCHLVLPGGVIEEVLIATIEREEGVGLPQKWSADTGTGTDCQCWQFPQHVL